LKREAILEHLGMAAAQIDQFIQALFGKVESVLIVCTILIVVVGIPLIWLRLKAERVLIETRSLPALARCFPPSFTFYVADPVSSIRGSATRAQSGAANLPTFCISLVPTRLDRCPRGLTGHVAHPGRSIGVAAIIPSVEAPERTSTLKLALLSEDLRAIMPQEGI
jgi:hypothetical protein